MVKPTPLQCAAMSEAVMRETFVCGACARLVSIDEGMYDDMPDDCDDCWTRSRPIVTAREHEDRLASLRAALKPKAGGR